MNTTDRLSQASYETGLMFQLQQTIHTMLAAIRHGNVPLAGEWAIFAIREGRVILDELETYLEDYSNPREES